MTAFVAVAEQLSFTQGAAKLGRDATVLSRHVQALEHRLGVRLLERTTRRVALTAAGARLLARAQSILAETTNLAHRCAQKGAHGDIIKQLQSLLVEQRAKKRLLPTWITEKLAEAGTDDSQAAPVSPPPS